MSPVKFDSIARFLPSGIYLDQPEKDEIVSSFEIHRLDKNDHFLREGDRVNLIGGVIHGILYRYYYDLNGKLHIDQFITNDHFFTECKCYKNNLPSYTNIIAVTPCEIATISTQKMEALRKAGPIYEQIIHEVTFNSMQGRIDIDEMFLQGSQAERIERFYNYYKLYMPYIPKEIVAIYLQMSRSKFYYMQKT